MDFKTSQNGLGWVYRELHSKQQSFLQNWNIHPFYQVYNIIQKNGVMDSRNRKEIDKKQAKINQKVI